jgi:hypothetical protein
MFSDNTDENTTCNYYEYSAAFLVIARQANTDKEAAVDAEGKLLAQTKATNY